MRLLGKRLGLIVIKTPKMYGSIVAPYEKNTAEGKVKYVGDELDNFSPGDRVIYDQNEGEKIVDPLDREDLLIMNVKDILCKVER